jgi:transposase
MAKRRFQLTEQQDKELWRAFAESKDGATRTRYQAVRMYGLEYEVAEIEELTGCTRASLMNWCRKYREQGIASLADHRKGGNRARLKPEQIEEVSERLRAYTPRDLFGPDTTTASGQHWMVEDLARAVQGWYGVTWKSRVSYHNLFALLNLINSCRHCLKKS